jgi:hypothetical protein
MRQVVFTCPTTGRTTRSLMVEFETDPLDGLDATDCSECGRAHIVFRQTGKPLIRKGEPTFDMVATSDMAATSTTLGSATKRAS